jgi:hypothetical protein
MIRDAAQECRFVPSLCVPETRETPRELLRRSALSGYPCHSALRPSGRPARAETRAGPILPAPAPDPRARLRLLPGGSRLPDPATLSSRSATDPVALLGDTCNVGADRAPGQARSVVRFRESWLCFAKRPIQQCEAPPKRENPEGALPKLCPLGVVPRPCSVPCGTSSGLFRSVLSVTPIPVRSGRSRPLREVSLLARSAGRSRRLLLEGARAVESPPPRDRSPGVVSLRGAEAPVRVDPVDDRLRPVSDRPKPGLAGVGAAATQ